MKNSGSRLSWGIIAIIIIVVCCLSDIHLDNDRINNVEYELDSINSDEKYVVLNAIDSPRKVAYKTKDGYSIIDGSDVSNIFVFVDKSIDKPYLKIVHYDTYVRYEFYVKNESYILETKTKDSVSKIFTNIVNFRENWDGEL